MVCCLKNKILLKQIYILYFLERASFNGIRVILILNLSRTYNLIEEDLYLIFVSVLSLILVIPSFLSYFLDKFTNNKNILISSLAISLTGNFLLFKQNIDYLFMALSLIICGTGLFKLRISSLIGELSDSDDIKDKNYFKFFIYGSAGSIFGITLFSCIGEVYSWLYCFSFSSISLILGIFILVKAYAESTYDIRELKYLLTLLFVMQFIILIFLYTIKLIYIKLFFPIFFIAGAVQIFYLSKNYKKSILIFYLMLINFIFTILFVQSETSLVLFIENHVNNELNIFQDIKFNIPITFYQTLDPIFVLICGPLATSLLSNRLYMNIKSTCCKLNIGLILLSISMFVLYYSHLNLSNERRISLYWIVISVFFLSISELLISPTGMAIISKLSSKNKRNSYMGLWLGFEGYAILFAAVLARMTTIKSDNYQTLALRNYYDNFYSFGLLALTVPLLTIIYLILYFLYCKVRK